MWLQQIAEAAAASDDLHWYEQQLTGVVAGASIAAIAALAVARANQRHARATRWDEARRLAYSAFLSADRALDEANKAWADASLKWLRSTSDSERTEAGLAEQAKREGRDAALREMYDRRVDVRIFGGDPVLKATDNVVNKTCQAGFAYHEVEKAHDHASLHEKVPDLVTAYGLAKQARDDAIDVFTASIRRELRTN